MAGPAENELTTDLARDLIQKLSPQELPLFRAHSEAYFKDPASALKKQPGKEDMLGFGVGEALTLLTPIALAVAGDVVKFVFEEVKKTAEHEGAAFIAGKVKEMFARAGGAAAPAKGDAGGAAAQKPKADPATLTRDQLLHVRRLAFEKARTLNIPEAQAGLLADAVVGTLATQGS